MRVMDRGGVGKKRRESAGARFTPIHRPVIFNREYRTPFVRTPEDEADPGTIMAILLTVTDFWGQGDLAPEFTAFSTNARSLRLLVRLSIE